MAIELPAAPRVYTTTYDNFKGVDFTNDSTNVWRRRSPTGMNMLPDASGRPFKRHGWDVLLSQEYLCDALEVTECTINKLSYFELAGVDHIVVFTDNGVLFYNGEVTAVNKDPDCYSAYDRNFFFEGGGTSAFYIYGNYRMWRYGYDTTFVFAEITDELYKPTVIIGASADGVGTLYEPYNILYNKAKIDYQDYELFTFWGTKDLVFTVNETGFKNDHAKPSPTYYHWIYDNGEWVDKSDIGTAFDSANITAPDPKQDDEIVVVFGHALMIPNNIDINSQGLEVSSSVTKQFDNPLTPVTSRPIGDNHYIVHQDVVKRDNPQTWIELDPDSTYELGTDRNSKFYGEDTFEIVFPSTQIDVVSYTDDTDPPTSLIDESSASLDNDLGGGN